VVNRPPIGTRFLSALISCGAFPIITKLTRVTDSSATTEKSRLEQDFSKKVFFYQNPCTNRSGCNQTRCENFSSKS